MPDNPQVNVVLTAEDQGVAAALRELNTRLKQVKTQADETNESTRRFGEGAGGVRAQIGLLDNTIRGAHAQAMADLVRRFSNVDAVMRLLPIAATGGAFVLLGGIVLDLVRKFESLRDSESAITQAERELQTASNNTMGKLKDQVLEAQIQVDKLTGNSLKALQEELEHIDHESMGDLVSQFESLNKELAVFLKPLEGHWWEPWDSGSTQIEKDMTELQAKIANVQSQMSLETPGSKEYKAQQQDINKLLGDAITRYTKILALQKEAAEQIPKAKVNAVPGGIYGQPIGVRETTPAEAALAALGAPYAGAGANEQLAYQKALDTLKLEQQSVALEQKRADLQKQSATIEAGKTHGKSIAQREVEENARAAKQFAEIIKGMERAKAEAEKKMAAAHDQELKQEAEENDRAAKQFDRVIKDMERAKEEALKRVDAQTAAIAARTAAAGGDTTYKEELALKEADAAETKALAQGNVQLAAAYMRLGLALKQYLATQRQMITGDQVLHTISGSMQTAFNSLFDSIGRGSHSVAQAFGQMELQVIHSLENIASEMVANLAIALMTDNMMKLSSAKTAAVNTWKSVSAIPYVGWILAPAAAAKAFADAMAYREGGLVRGPGGPTSDHVPAMLSNGEYVLKASAVSSIGASRLDSLNAGDIEHAGHTEIHVHPEMNFYHHGPDAREVMERELAPAIEGMFRRGALKVKP